MKEFLDLIPNVPNKGFVAWDEPGIVIGHRTWLSPANMAISMIAQSFRYRLINVMFALPSRYYLDKVPRELCHFELMMQRRGVANVYKIYKSAFTDFTYTKYLGGIQMKLPPKHLTYEYERMRREHQDALYEKLQKQETIRTMKMEKKIEKALTPEVGGEELLARAKMILPQIIDWEKAGYTNQGLINVQKLRATLEISGVKLAHNASYNLRKRLVEELHANNDALLNKLRRKYGKQVEAESIASTN